MDGINRIEDEPRPDKPPSTASERDVATVKRIVEEDARYTNEEKSDTSGLNSSSVFFYFKRKIKVTEGLRALNIKFTDC